MARVAIAMLWLVAAGSAQAAYMRGTLTFDDGRTATIAVHRFRWAGSWNEGNRAALVRCRGGACFASTAYLNLFYNPIEYDLNYGEVNIPTTGPHGYYQCGTQDSGLGVPRSCRIESRVVCKFESFDDRNGTQVDIATGMLKLHRTTPSCQRALRRAARLVATAHPRYVVEHGDGLGREMRQPGPNATR
jgi:hypothetical protein